MQSEKGYSEMMREYIRDPDPEPIICKHFGCGEKLTKEESLYGNKCSDHVVVKPIDIMQVLKFE